MLVNQPLDPLEEARRAGIDLNLLDTLLSQPVAVRWRQHDAALALVLRLEKGKQIANDRLISLQDLIASKEALGREKDLLTAQELRAIAAKRRGI